MDESKKLCIRCNSDRPIHSDGYCKSCYSRKHWHDNWHKRLINSCKYRPGVPCNITADDLLELYKQQNGKCYWFGVDMVRNPDNMKDPQQPSLDRLDPNKGYVKGNVVLACFAANIGRNRTTPERFREFVSLLKKGDG